MNGLGLASGDEPKSPPLRDIVLNHAQASILAPAAGLAPMRRPDGVSSAGFAANKFHRPERKLLRARA